MKAGFDMSFLELTRGKEGQNRAHFGAPVRGGGRLCGTLGRQSDWSDKSLRRGLKVWVLIPASWCLT